MLAFQVQVIVSTSLVLILVRGSTIPAPKYSTFYPRFKFPIRNSSWRHIEFENRIYGGQTAKINQFPFTSLLNIDNGTYYCGGSLIHPIWILTAAHCVYGATNVTARLGSLAMNSGGQIFEIAKIFPYSQYNPDTHPHDIALLKLSSPVSVQTKNIGLIRLHTKMNKICTSMSPPLSRLTVLGWGITEREGQISTHLKFTTMHEITNFECYYSYGFNYVPPTVMCSKGNKGTSSCSGDSGSPVVVHLQGGGMMQVGVVAFGGEKCGDDMPSGFTRVAMYLDWIRFVTGINL